MPAPIKAYSLGLVLTVALAAGCGGDPRPPAAAPGPTNTARATTAPATTPPGSPSALPSPPATAKPPATSRPPAAGNGRYVFPVAGSNVSYHPTHAVYPATDIFAPCGTPVVAVADGRILEVSRVDRYDPAGPAGPFNGGKFVSLLGDDGVRYYGSHLTDVSTGIAAGVRVRAGQRVGSVGKTGNANNVCHLHFGISPPCQKTGDWWIRRGVVWPATFLDAWRKRTSRSPVATVTAWHRERGCPKAP
jgi:murein DD-endopeptidase MepM/ murein hydrolase activator NlpD